MNILIAYSKRMKDATVWITSGSLFLTLLIVQLTSDFKEFMNIPKDVWCAIFIILLCASGLWTLVSVARYFMSKKKLEIKYLINEIKNVP